MEYGMDYRNLDGTREAYDEDTLVVEIAGRAAAIGAKKTSKDAAADISQQVALECLARLRSGALVIDRKSLGGLARTMARGRRIDAKRHRRTREKVETQYWWDNADNVPPWMSPEVQLEEAELDRFYRSVLDSLRPRARLKFIMVRELGLSYDEVATQLHITKHAVQWNMVRAQHRFRDELGKIGVEAPKVVRAAASPRAAVPAAAQQNAAPVLLLIRGDVSRTATLAITKRKGVA